MESAKVVAAETIKSAHKPIKLANLKKENKQADLLANAIKRKQ